MLGHADVLLGLGCSPPRARARTRALAGLRRNIR
jgi:hypothetical protein